VLKVLTKYIAQFTRCSLSDQQEAQLLLTVGWLVFNGKFSTRL